MKMCEMMERCEWRWTRWVGWLGATALIATPLVAMKFFPDAGVNWTASDFLFGVLMTGMVGLSLELLLRRDSSWTYRLGGLIAVGTGVLLIWGNLAVGYIGDGGNPINMVLLVIPALALTTAFAVKCRARAMASLLAVTGVAHGIAGAIGYWEDPRTGLMTIVFVGLWLTAAALFRSAARD